MTVPMFVDLHGQLVRLAAEFNLDRKRTGSLRLQGNSLASRNRVIVNVDFAVSVFFVCDEIGARL